MTKQTENKTIDWRERFREKFGTNLWKEHHNYIKTNEANIQIDAGNSWVACNKEVEAFIQQELDLALAERTESLEDKVYWAISAVEDARFGYNSMLGMLSSGLYYKSKFKKECARMSSLLTKRLNDLKQEESKGMKKVTIELRDYQVNIIRNILENYLEQPINDDFFMARTEANEDVKKILAHLDNTLKGGK